MRETLSTAISCLRPHRERGLRVLTVVRKLFMKLFMVVPTPDGEIRI
jgi:hypothetical protein